MKTDKESIKKIPSIEDWEDWSDYSYDTESIFAKQKFFGKSLDEMLWFFKDNPVSVFEYLMLMPNRVFQYYIFGYVLILQQQPDLQKYDWPGSRSMVSSFLKIVVLRLKIAPKSVMPVLEDLMPSLEKISKGQKAIDASVEVYGSFPEMLNEIKTIAAKHHK